MVRVLTKVRLPEPNGSASPLSENRVLVYTKNMKNETTLTKLSPAAQAVLDATGTTGTPLELAARGIAAAALRAVADRVEPTFNHSNEWEEGFIDGVESVQNGLYAIATELEAQ